MEYFIYEVFINCSYKLGKINQSVSEDLKWKTITVRIKILNLLKKS